MYGSSTAERLGIVGRSLQYEANLLANLKYEQQRSKIDQNLETLDQMGVDNLKDFIHSAGTGKFGAFQ